MNKPNRDDFIRSELKDLMELCESWLDTGKLNPAVVPVFHQIKARLHHVLDEMKPVTSKLTKKEKEILIHVSQGFTNREISLALEVSEKTIEFHMGNIFQKTQASTRSEAVTCALSLGWIP